MITGSVAYDCIETPEHSEDFILGGSASYAALAASFFTPARIVAVVGNDFKKSDVKRLVKRGVNLDNLAVNAELPTFLWRGKYHDNFNSRDTIDVQLNAFEGYNPILDDASKAAQYVLLGNISPEVQTAVLKAVKKPKFVVLDSMDLWINITRPALDALVKKCDLFILNDSEARLMTGEHNIINAGNRLRKSGSKSVIIKLGEYGSMLFHRDGFFTIPAYPVKQLYDPTGAGDSFAGALTGYIAKADKTDFSTIKKAMLYASATASITVESFSCYKLEKSGLKEIEKRVRKIREISKI